jgi:hypothetical protein
VQHSQYTYVRLKKHISFLIKSSIWIVSNKIHIQSGQWPRHLLFMSCIQTRATSIRQHSIHASIQTPQFKHFKTILMIPLKSPLIKEGGGGQTPTTCHPGEDWWVNDGVRPKKNDKHNARGTTYMLAKAIRDWSMSSKWDSS